MTTANKTLVTIGAVIVVGAFLLFLAWRGAIATAADYKARVEMARAEIHRLDSALVSQWTRVDSLEQAVAQRDIRIDSLHQATDAARRRVREALAAIDNPPDFSDETDSVLIARLRGAFRLRTDH